MRRVSAASLIVFQGLAIGYSQATKKTESSIALNEDQNRRIIIRYRQSFRRLWS